MALKLTKKHLFEAIKIIVSSVAVIYLFSKIDLNEVKELLFTCNPYYILLAVVCFVLSKVLAAIRLRIFLKDILIDITQVQNFKLYLLGMFYNLFLPGGIGGDGYKIYLLNKRTKVSAKRITSALVIDRVNGMCVIVALCLCLLLAIPLPTFIYYLILPIVVLGFYLYMLFVKKTVPYFSVHIWVTTFLSMGVQLLQCLSILSIILAIDVSGNLLQWFFVFMLSSVATIIPITVGGLGTREFVFFFSSQHLQIENSTAITISLMFYVITCLVSLMGSYYSLSVKRLKI